MNYYAVGRELITVYDNRLALIVILEESRFHRDDEESQGGVGSCLTIP